jgi:RloB-like protein
LSRSITVMRRSDRLGRRKPFRQPRPRFLIACEGTVTEPHYFSEIRRLLRSIVELQIIPGGTPKTIVKSAAARKKEAEVAARRRRDENLRFDEVWCVFDVDMHPLLPEARQQANDNGIHVALSNPCFELWMLLHFQDQHAHIERGAVQHLCRQHIPGYRKTPPCEELAEYYGRALARAVELDRWHQTRGTEGANPSTGVYRLLEKMRGSSAE